MTSLDQAQQAGVDGATEVMATAAKEALTLRMEWMWEDSGISKSFAKKNPLRWSGGTPLEVVASLREHGVCNNLVLPLPFRDAPLVLAKLASAYFPFHQYCKMPNFSAPSVSAS